MPNYTYGNIKEAKEGDYVEYVGYTGINTECFTIGKLYKLRADYKKDIYNKSSWSHLDRGYLQFCNDDKGSATNGWGAGLFKLVAGTINDKVRRNLAFYKASGTPWTKEEYGNIQKYCGLCKDDSNTFSGTYIFDCGAGRNFMYTWSQADTHPNLTYCTKIAYEDVFSNSDQVSEPGFMNYPNTLDSSSTCLEIPTPNLPNKPTQKETTMPTIQQVLFKLFGTEKPTTDYENRPAYLVVAYNRDGSEMGTATAISIKAIKDKVAITPELWGCKVLAYKLDKEVSVTVPVKAADITIHTPTEEPTAVVGL